MEDNIQEVKLAPKKNKTIYIIVGIIAVIVLVSIAVAVSWAYFTVTVIGNDQASSSRVVAGMANVEFDGSEYFNNPSMYPMKDADVLTDADAINFSVQSLDTSNLPLNYVVSLTDVVISDNFKSDEFKWQLELNGEVIETGDFLNIGTETFLELTATPLVLEPNTTDTLTLRAWLSETPEDQSHLFNGSFTGKVSVTLKSE